VENPEGWSDHEALVYLVSRNKHCAASINEWIGMWRDAEREVLQGRPAKDVPSYNFFEVRNFWGYSDEEELTIPATMLRVVQCCLIKGFESWWQRLANDVMEAAFNGGIHWSALFSLCQSDYALQHMNAALRRCLEGIEVSASTSCPPWQWIDRKLGCAMDHAAAIAFASAQVSSGGQLSALTNLALNDIRKQFNHEVGAWPAFEAERRCWRNSANGL
jgi:hypothetical protein